MVSFTSNKIFLDSEAIAEQLINARQEKGLKLQDIAKKIKINHKYLESLERGNLSALPKGVYGKNFLKEYALFLGLDYREMVKVFDDNIVKTNNNAEELFCQQASKTNHFLMMPKIIRNIIAASLVVVCFFYLGHRLGRIVSPPQIVVENPQENFVTNEKIINLSGVAEPETQIDINGEPILTDVQGHFSKKIDLKEGVNVIIVKAKKKYGRESIVKREILVKNQIEL